MPCQRRNGPRNVAVMYRSSKEQAEKYLRRQPGEMKEVALTVPAHYTPFQREVLRQLLPLVGIGPVTILNDLTAVAIDYSSRRDFPQRYVVKQKGRRGGGGGRG